MKPGQLENPLIRCDPAFIDRTVQLYPYQFGRYH